MMWVITIFAFVQVFTRAMQQLNVIHHYYGYAFITSFFIAAGDIGVIVLSVQHGWYSTLFVGLGGGIGVVGAMYCHKQLRGQGKHVEE